MVTRFSQNPLTLLLHPTTTFTAHVVKILSCVVVNPRGSKLQSHTVSDLNHSANRVYTIGTEMFPSHVIGTHFVGLIPSVSQCKIYHNFLSLEASLRGSIYLSM